MLFVFIGSDTEASRAKLNAAVAEWGERFPGAERFVLEGGEISEVRLKELAGASGLFVERTIVILREPLSQKESEEVVTSLLEDIGRSPNIFLLWERGTLAAKIKTALNKYAEEMIETGTQKAVRERSDASGTVRDNPFALADALGMRDKKKLWILFAKASFEGKAPEEVHGMLFWQVKAMLAAAQSKTPVEAGLSPYPFNKARGFGRNYSIDELRGLSHDLVAMYHDARRGRAPLELALERWVLGL